MNAITSNAIANLPSEIDTSTWSKTGDMAHGTVYCFRIAYNIAIVEITCDKSGTGLVICGGEIDTNGTIKRNIFGLAPLGYSVSVGDTWNITPKWCQVTVTDGNMSPLFSWDTSVNNGIGKVSILAELNN